MDRGKQTNESEARFGGIVCFWRIPRKPGQSPRERFFSIYEDLREAVKQNLPLPVTSAAQRKWSVIRISEPGRWFLGFGRR